MKGGRKLEYQKSSKITISLLVIVILVLIWSAINPLDYLDWLAEVSPGLVIIIILVLTYTKFRFTTLSYIIIAFLCVLTFIGGHFTYSEVPMFNWIKDEFDLKRNHYDRMGHFFKGFSAIVVREILLRFTPLSKGVWLFGITTSILLSIAAVYEIIEWLSTKIAKGSKTAKNFVGMQGDKWDAQWDMALALTGCIIALLILSKCHNKLLRK